jgi:hypothetical protein
LNIAQGSLQVDDARRAPGRRITPPEALLRSIAEREPRYGPFPGNDSEAGLRWLLTFQDDCALLRATLIQVEERPGREAYASARIPSRRISPPQRSVSAAM